MKKLYFILFLALNSYDTVFSVSFSPLEMSLKDIPAADISHLIEQNNNVFEPKVLFSCDKEIQIFEEGSGEKEKFFSEEKENWRFYYGEKKVKGREREYSIKKIVSIVPLDQENPILRIGTFFFEKYDSQESTDSHRDRYAIFRGDRMKCCFGMDGLFIKCSRELPEISKIIKENKGEVVLNPEDNNVYYYTSEKRLGKKTFWTKHEIFGITTERCNFIKAFYDKSLLSDRLIDIFFEKELTKDFRDHLSRLVEYLNSFAERWEPKEYVSQVRLFLEKEVRVRGKDKVLTDFIIELYNKTKLSNKIEDSSKDELLDPSQISDFQWVCQELCEDIKDPFLPNFERIKKIQEKLRWKLPLPEGKDLYTYKYFPTMKRLVQEVTAMSQKDKEYGIEIYDNEGAEREGFSSKPHNEELVKRKDKKREKLNFYLTMFLNSDQLGGTLPEEFRNLNIPSENTLLVILNQLRLKTKELEEAQQKIQDLQKQLKER
jgi:hypothetical protein